MISSRTVITLLEKNGWVLVATKGDHLHFKNAANPGLVTVPHPRKEMVTRTLKSIETLSGVTLC